MAREVRCRRATNSQGSSRRSVLSRDQSRQQSRAGVSRRCRLPPVHRADERSASANRTRGICRLPDAQSLSFVGEAPAGSRSGCLDALAADDACAPASPTLPIERSSVAGQIQGVSGAGRRPFAHGHSLYRTQCAASWAGTESRTVALGSLRWRTSVEAPFLLTPPPISLPMNWTTYVNMPQTGAELERLRTCVNRQQPFGNAGWAEQTARALGLSSSLRPVGRPLKQQN